MTNAAPILLRLDHASVVVPVLAEAIAHLDHVLGLHATVSVADPEHHSRIFLHHSYLEVAARPATAGWHVTHFFLGFEDPEILRNHLDAAGITSRFGVYEGIDGRWDDVEIEVGSTPMPILVRRTHPPDVARRWPPPLAKPHRCGARALVAVHLGVQKWKAAVTAYRRLLGLGATKFGSGVTADHSRRMSLPLASGHLVLTEGDTDGVAGLVLGVRSLDETVATVGRTLFTGRDDRVAWIDPAATFGVRVGFVEPS